MTIGCPLTADVRRHWPITWYPHLRLEEGRGLGGPQELPWAQGSPEGQTKIFDVVQMVRGLLSSALPLCRSCSRAVLCGLFVWWPACPFGKWPNLTIADGQNTGMAGDGRVPVLRLHKRTHRGCPTGAGARVGGRGAEVEPGVGCQSGY